MAGLIRNGCVSVVCCRVYWTWGQCVDVESIVNMKLFVFFFIHFHTHLFFSGQVGLGGQEGGELGWLVFSGVYHQDFYDIHDSSYCCTQCNVVPLLLFSRLSLKQRWSSITMSAAATCCDPGPTPSGSPSRISLTGKLKRWEWRTATSPCLSLRLPWRRKSLTSQTLLQR